MCPNGITWCILCFIGSLTILLSNQAVSLATFFFISRSKFLEVKLLVADPNTIQRAHLFSLERAVF